MEKKRSKGIVLVAIILFLLPLILTILGELIFFIGAGERLSWTFNEWISTMWPGFVLFGVLGYGIFNLNNKSRLATVGITITFRTYLFPEYQIPNELGIQV